ncbi:hypothetical protein [Rhizobium leguminosarum]|uniref:hypothetical protein n=1 Tax=Rhizobium leguminosarum TaxID=384 RepID=UPI000F7A353E|nr:hypothetical protein [Rhizobium leguminosarum]
MAMQAPAALNFRHDFNGCRCIKLVGLPPMAAFFQSRASPASNVAYLLFDEPAREISPLKIMVKTLLKALAL